MLINCKLDPHEQIMIKNSILSIFNTFLTLLKPFIDIDRDWDSQTPTLNEL